MGRVWDLVEQHMTETPYGASGRAIAEAAGLRHSTLAAWKTLRRLPQPDHLRAVARQINVPYRVLLDAALTDAGYLEDRHGTPIGDDESATEELRRRAREAHPERPTAPARPGPRTIVDMPDQR